jgi:hypothetical protein
MAMSVFGFWGKHWCSSIRVTRFTVLSDFNLGIFFQKTAQRLISFRLAFCLCWWASFNEDEGEEGKRGRRKRKVGNRSRKECCIYLLSV